MNVPTFEKALGERRRLVDRRSTCVGHRAIEQAAAGLLRRYPEYDFARLGEVDEIPDAARLRWVFGAVGNSPGITGMDIITASDGRIVSM